MNNKIFIILSGGFLALFSLTLFHPAGPVQKRLAQKELPIKAADRTEVFGITRLPSGSLSGAPERKAENKPRPQPLRTPKEDTSTEDGKPVLEDVSFTAQAPTGDWKDIRQQDACEEASSLMAVKWARGESLDPSTAEKDILDIVDFEAKNYGSYLDTSAADTAERILSGYFHFNNYKISKDMTLEGIKKELYRGNILVAPADGQKLGNPYFTAPGPERHMLVIIGYDPAAREFITNDPGTRRGEHYRYGEDVLYGALRDYGTGYALPIPEVHKDAIIVSPEK